MIYVSAAWWAKYHADFADIEPSVARTMELVKGYTYSPADQSSLHASWSVDSRDPLDTVTRLQSVLEGATDLLILCRPDMVSVSTRDGERAYSLYWTWNSDEQARRETIAKLQEPRNRTASRGNDR